MKTTVGDVIICEKPNVTVRLVAVVRQDGEEPDDIQDWRETTRGRAEQLARSTVSATGGRVFRWNGRGELEPADPDSF